VRRVLSTSINTVAFSSTRLASTLTLTTGAEYERAQDDRTGYANNNGVKGALSRNEINVVRQTGAYAQAQWDVTPAVSLSGGLRYTRVSFDSEDHFINGTNPERIAMITRWQTEDEADARARQRLKVATIIGALSVAAIWLAVAIVPQYAPIVATVAVLYTVIVALEYNPSRCATSITSSQSLLMALSGEMR